MFFGSRLARWAWSGYRYHLLASNVHCNETMSGGEPVQWRLERQGIATSLGQKAEKIRFSPVLVVVVDLGP